MSYRLLKVMCQAVLISEDEDGNLIESTSQVTPVMAKDWLDYPKLLLSQIDTYELESAVR